MSLYIRNNEPYKIAGQEAYTVEDLVKLCINNWEEGLKHFENDYMRPWLEEVSDEKIFGFYCLYQLYKSINNEECFRNFLLSTTVNNTAEKNSQKVNAMKKEFRKRDVNEVYENFLGMEFIYVKAGEFMMGNDSSNKVQIPIDFYIGKYPVKLKDFLLLFHFDMDKSTLDSYQNSERLDEPVQGITWDFANKVINRINRMDLGWHYRLPLEIEWEFAAKGGIKSKGYKYSGSNTLDEVAWYGENSDLQLHNLGDKKSNELGIFDLSGNVAEWCDDWVNKDSDYMGHVFRGGDFLSPDEYCSVSYRGYEPPTFNPKCLGLGLRLVFSS